MTKYSLGGVLFLIAMTAITLPARAGDYVGPRGEVRSMPSSYESQPADASTTDNDNGSTPASSEKQVVNPRGDRCCDNTERKKYDSQEVIKTSRDVDHSRTINTTSVVHVPPRVRTTNHLIIRENQTRNVGVIQHNHTIIEKEIRYVRRRPSWPTPNVVVVQQARIVQVPTQVYVPMMYVQRADGYYVPYTYPRSGCGC